MEIIGPCHVLLRDGKQVDLQLVSTVKFSLLTCITTAYYFHSVADAELYISYLQQEEGLRNLESILSSKKIPEYEKKGYREFRDSLEPEILRNAVKSIDVEIIVKKTRRKK